MPSYEIDFAFCNLEFQFLSIPAVICICSPDYRHTDTHWTITNSDLNRPCFAWHPYGKSGLFKTEILIVVCPKLEQESTDRHPNRQTDGCYQVHYIPAMRSINIRVSLFCPMPIKINPLRQSI